MLLFDDGGRNGYCLLSLVLVVTFYIHSTKKKRGETKIRDEILRARRVGGMRKGDSYLIFYTRLSLDLPLFIFVVMSSLQHILKINISFMSQH
jgi:hypothetical protein